MVIFNPEFDKSCAKNLSGSYYDYNLPLRLCDFARSGNLKETEKYPKFSADKGIKAVCSILPESNTLLHISLHWVKDVGMVDFLIKNCADINAQDNRGYIVLYWAAWYEYKEIVKLLIEHDADIIKNKDGKLPSELAKDELVLLTVKIMNRLRK